MKVVMLTSQYCKPCKAMKPIMIDLCTEKNVVLNIYDVEKDNTGIEISQRYSIYTVPAIIFMRGEEILWMTYGAMSKNELS